MAKPPHAVYFTRVVALAADHLILSGQLRAFPDRRATRLAEWKRGEWSHLADVPEIVASLSVEQVGEKPTVFAMLRNGVTHRLVNGQHSVEVIDRTRGLFFSELRGIGGMLFACGAGYQVFTRDEAEWRPIDAGIFIDPSAAREQARLATRKILTSIDGYGPDDVTVVGTGGAIFRFDGTKWYPVESPTNLGFMRVRYYSDTIYACGYHQLLLRRRKNGWRVVSHEYGTAPLLDMVMFAGTLYLASEFALFALDGEELRVVEPPFEGELTFGSLAVANSHLVSVGGEDILMFDGMNWIRIECPWNREQ